MPHRWKTIRLELAGTSDFPAGSPSRAYLVQLPLNASGNVDEDVFQEHPDWAIFRRHWGSEPDERGSIRPAPRGWAMQTPGKSERILDIGTRPLRPDERVALVDQDGTTFPLTVVSVR